jgi:hypothetical protein
MVRRRGWHFWVLNLPHIQIGRPPRQWKTILRILSQIISDTYIDKIEVAAFTIRGKRTARWKVTKSHPEFATMKDSLGAAKKLTWMLLMAKGSPKMSARLLKILKCTKLTKCSLLEGHGGKCRRKSANPETTRCPVCREIIRLTDFGINARTDPLSIQMGHLTPLSQKPKGHNAANVVWAHRRCNYIQDEQTVKETIKTLREIVKRHGFKVSSVRQ